MAAKAKAAKAAAKKAMAAKKQHASSAAAATAAQPLALAQHDPTRPPPMHHKDQTVFKQILHLYETKQYAAALQLCDALLAKYPGHGETTAMAGLLHHSMNDKPQGYTLVKAGMKADLKSHIVWHVYGIMTRADRNYTEAVKSYSQALRLDPENHNILRDLAVLQIQVRQYDAYVESRWKLLRANRRSRTAWLSLAMAYVLNDQKEAALEVLDAMEGYEVIYEPEQSFERSEMVLFKASILAPSKALEYLDSHSNIVLDRTKYMLTRAKYLAELGRQEASEWAWLDLLDSNDENQSYLDGYLRSRMSTATENPVDILKRLAERYPTSKLIGRSLLDYSTGNQFEEELEVYLSSRLTKGIPSVFNDVKPLLLDSAKQATIKLVAERFRRLVSENGHLRSTGACEAEPPSTLVWVLHFLTQLYASRHLNMTAEALEAAQQAIQHTPCLPDLYISLAHVYKRAGSFDKAAVALRAARELDGQDRFLNSKCAKYVLQTIGKTNQTAEVRTQLLEESRRLVGLFTRKDAPDPVSDLVDMQAVWYVMAEAEVALRVLDWGMALKRLHQVVEIFRQWEEDQYDFHTYCIRKSTFQAYTDLLRVEDTLYTHPHYYRAISKAISIYLTLHDRVAAGGSEAPSITEFNILPPPNVSITTNGASPANEADQKQDGESGMSKKALKKAKMAEIKAKAQAAHEAKRAMSKTKSGDQANSATPDVVPPVKDEDPTGEKLLKTERPLEVASDLLKPAENDLVGQVEPTDKPTRLIWKGIHLLRFEIELRKDRPLLALRALLKAHTLSSDGKTIDPQVFIALTKLKTRYLPRKDSSLAIEPLTKILNTGLEDIDKLDLPKGPEGRLTKAEALAAERKLTGTEGPRLEQIEEEVFFLLTECCKTDWEIALKGLKLLESCRSTRTGEFQEKAAAVWSMVDQFKTAGTHLNGHQNGNTKNIDAETRDF